MKNKYIYILIGIFAFSSCNLEPNLDASFNETDVWKDRDYAMGVLNESYRGLYAFYSDEYGGFLDCATDNAVTNDFNSSLITAATGGLRADANPINSWKKCYSQIKNLNEFIEKSPHISFSNDKKTDEVIHQRVKGESYFLRAWYQFELLSRFAGLDDNQNMLGYPIVVSVLKDDEIRNVPRSKFDECVAQIEKDLAVAIENLPKDQYSGNDIVLGETQTGRGYLLPALSLRSRLLLYAASPAYTVKKTDIEKQKLWEDAAIASMDVIKKAGSLPSIPLNGSLYTNPNHAEVIWRSFQPESNKPEKENFYPSLWGNGRTNPSQQLADAFPMKDGYPIDQSTNYDASNPYVGRDNRFGLTIVYNAATFGKDVVETFVGGKDYPAPGVERGTRTGYYLRKFLDPTITLSPDQAVATVKHYYAFFRKGEMWLNYSEAANEAWGADVDPKGMGKTAKQALGEIRARAGIPSADPYLQQVSNAGVDEMRALIQNERRIELSFENHRYFDVRRWLLPLDKLNESIKGIHIVKNETDGTLTYQAKENVEPRKFTGHMYYSPLPEQEIYSSNGAIVQNAGW